MPRPVWNVHGGPTRISTTFSGSSSTKATAADVMPYQNWSVQATLAATSTALTPVASVTLQGTVDPVSSTPSWTTLVAWTSSGTGTGIAAYVTGRPVVRTRMSAVVSTTSTAHTATLNAWYAGG